jgi:hypothetical protein
MKSIKASIALLLLAHLLPQPVGAVASRAVRLPRRRAVAAKPLTTVVPEGFYLDRLSVKFVEGSAVRLRNGDFVTLGADDLGPLQVVLAGRVNEIVRGFTRSERALDREQAKIETLTGEQAADLNLYYLIVVVDGVDVGGLIDDLNQLALVELAEPVPMPAPLPQAAPGDYTARQGYRTAATVGIDALFTEGIRGGRGDRVTIADVEYSWNLAHQDLPATHVIPPAPVDPFNPPNDHHGTAVLGEIVGRPNAFGVTGIANRARMRVAGVCTGAPMVCNVADAINRAAARLKQGDVILIEQQISGPNGGCPTLRCNAGVRAGLACTTDNVNAVTGCPGAACPGCCVDTQVGCAPVEWFMPSFDAISNATAEGIVVVEAAGNGTQDLDSAPYLRRFNRNLRDSGAIIVGAGGVPANPYGGAGPDRGRLGFSNYGCRVDLQGWGERVATTGYGDLFPGGAPPPAAQKNVFFTATFGGTSGASPIVTGAAAVLESIWEAGRRRPPISPTRMLGLLMNTGSAQTDVPPDLRHIGPRPNLLGAFGDLLINDSWAVKASQPSPREGLSAGRVGGAIYAIGGYDEEDTSVNEAYDILTNTWTAKTDAPSARSEMAAAVDCNSIYVVGGRSFTAGSVVGTLERYDVTTDSWATLAAMPTPRAGLGTAIVGSKLYAIGGRDGLVPHSGTPLAVMEVYDIATGTWAAGPAMPTPRMDIYSTAAVGEEIFVFGGFNLASGGVLDVVEAFNTTANAWIQLPAMPTPRSNAAAAFCNGHIAVVGGIGNADNFLAANELFNPTTGEWLVMPPLPTARGELGIAGAFDRFFAIGGGFEGTEAGEGRNEVFFCVTPARSTLG